ncbi:MAG: transporter, permease protein [Oscillospiraceae bacterium]|nr:transporter, permease protein [Oscillospiraceae bacterium]
MNLRQTLKIAFKSIGARKGRSFLTMLGIIIGLASVITLVSYAKGETQQMMDYLESMGTNKISVDAYSYQENINLFDDLYQYCLQMDTLVNGVTPNAYYSGKITFGAKSSYTMDYSPDLYLGGDQWSVCNNFTIEKGRDLTYLDIQENHQVVVLGADAATAFFDYADPLGKTMYVDGVPFTVIGVYAKKDFLNEGYTLDNVMVIPYTDSRVLTIANSYEVGSDMTNFVVSAKSAEATQQAVTRLDSFLSGLLGDMNDPMNNKGYYNVYSMNDSIDYATEASASQQKLLGGIAAISLLVGGIGIMNIMLVTVTERTREIGIRKAIGAQRKSIIVQFLIEASLLCGMGGILGILVGYLSTAVYCKLQLGYVVLPDASITGLAFLVSVVLGVVFGLYPAIKASGLQPVDALRTD